MILSIRVAAATCKQAASLSARRHIGKEMTYAVAAAAPRLSSSCRAISSTAQRLNMYQPLTVAEADPMKIFDEIDVNGDGAISREEFRQAVERMKYADLLKIHAAAAANLEALHAKMGKIEEIERNVDDLKETYRKKKHAYENVGWMNANDIDALFEDAAAQKQTMSDNVSDLKKLLDDAKKLWGA